MRGNAPLISGESNKFKNKETAMADKTFKAMLVAQAEDKSYQRSIVNRSMADLPEGDILVKVSYSSLNYKDALSSVGNKGVTRNYPHTPGIDAAGVVEDSTDPAFSPGDEVIVTSYDLGMNTWGGFGEYIRVPAGWVVPLPAGLTLREAMIYGTAGFTAALSVLRLTELVPPDRGDILVSGATGGVGGIAISILCKMGYQVVAVNGVVDEAEYLKGLGVKEVISIEEATDTSGRPMQRARWAGSIDTVGGDILASTIKAVDMAGAVTSCGNVASPDLPLNVFPFILRGVTLVGIDSQNCPMGYRLKTWEKLATEWKLDQLNELVTETDLEGLGERIDLMLAHKHKGRTIVKVA
jgi:putative YhdH/YhfP family quinone oxidoreductase